VYRLDSCWIKIGNSNRTAGSIGQAGIDPQADENSNKYQGSARTDLNTSIAALSDLKTPDEEQADQIKTSTSI
jgi:hypothetical protein